VCGRREYTPIKTKQAIQYIKEAWKQVKNQLLLIFWRKAGIINFRFSLTDAETDEPTTLSKKSL